MTTEKVYSRDNEVFDDLDSIMDSLRDDYDAGKEVEIYCGEADKYTHRQLLLVNQVIESMQDFAYDNVGEYSEDYLDDMDKEKQQQLEDLIVDFLDKNAEKPKFYKVKNITTLTVTVDE